MFKTKHDVCMIKLSENHFGTESFEIEYNQNITKFDVQTRDVVELPLKIVIDNVISLNAIAVIYFIYRFSFELSRWNRLCKYNVIHVCVGCVDLKTKKYSYRLGFLFLMELANCTQKSIEKDVTFQKKQSVDHFGKQLYTKTLVMTFRLRIVLFKTEFLLYKWNPKYVCTKSTAVFFVEPQCIYTHSDDQREKLFVSFIVYMCVNHNGGTYECARRETQNIIEMTSTEN